MPNLKTNRASLSFLLLILASLWVVQPVALFVMWESIAFSIKEDGALFYAQGKTKKVAPLNVVVAADPSCGFARATSLGTSVPLMHGMVLHVEHLNHLPSTMSNF